MAIELSMSTWRRRSGRSLCRTRTGSRRTEPSVPKRKGGSINSRRRHSITIVIIEIHTGGRTSCCSPLRQSGTPSPSNLFPSPRNPPTPWVYRIRGGIPLDFPSCVTSAADVGASPAGNHHHCRADGSATTRVSVPRKPHWTMLPVCAVLRVCSTTVPTAGVASSPRGEAVLMNLVRVPGPGKRPDGLVLGHSHLSFRACCVIGPARGVLRFAKPATPGMQLRVAGVTPRHWGGTILA